LGDPCGQDFAVFLCDMPALEWITQRGIDVFDGADQREPPPPPDSARMESPMQSAKRLLPELSLLQSQACWQKRKRHRALKESLTNIRTHCGTDKTKTSGQGSLYAQRCHADPCLVGLAQAICTYLRVLLMVNIGVHVVPSMRGLRSCYENRHVRSFVSVGQIYQAISGDQANRGSSGVDAFVGNGVSSEVHAWVGNGLCIFSCFLEDPMGPLHETQRFAAVRGYISYEDGWYESLHDMDTASYNPHNVSDDQDNQLHVVTNSRAITAQPAVEETDDDRSLRLVYKIRCSQLHMQKRSHWLRLTDLAVKKG